MRNASGFTVTETLMTIVLVGVIGTVGYSLFDGLQMTHRDQDRKTAINAMYANLEEVVKPKLGGYPRSLQASQLTAMNRSLLRDPSGKTIGTPGSDYRYEPTGCNGGTTCAGYTLRADLEREADYVKRNR